MDKVYELHQLHTNPRTGEEFSTSFEAYPTLAEAKKAAKKALGKVRWAITETRVVARSDEAA